MMNTAAFRSPHIPWRIRLARTPMLSTLAIRGGNAFLRTALRTALENHENMTPAVRAGYLAPYNSWSNRVAVDRFVKDIPRTPRHPSYETLLRHGTRIAVAGKSTLATIVGHARLVLSRLVFATVFGFYSSGGGRAAAGRRTLACRGRRLIEVIDNISHFFSKTEALAQSCLFNHSPPITNSCPPIFTSEFPKTSWSLAPRTSSQLVRTSANGCMATIIEWLPKWLARWIEQQCVIDFIALRDTLQEIVRGLDHFVLLPNGASANPRGCQRTQRRSDIPRSPLGISSRRLHFAAGTKHHRGKTGRIHRRSIADGIAEEEIQTAAETASGSRRMLRPNRRLRIIR